jgi:hypothetical protein
MSDRVRRVIGLYAVVAAAVGVVLAPLLALSYFATSEGVEELEMGTVSAWAAPGRDVAGGLLTWASPDRVYSTYVQGFALLFVGVFLCALAVRSRREPAGGNERWGWRIALTGYALAAVGVLGVSFGLITGDAANPVVDIAFMAFLFPGMLISVIGSTVLGIAFLRAGYRPRLTAWLLTLAFPLGVALSTFVGHNSIGLLPLMIAWAATGLRLWREGEPARSSARSQQIPREEVA